MVQKVVSSYEQIPKGSGTFSVIRKIFVLWSQVWSIKDCAATEWAEMMFEKARSLMKILCLMYERFTENQVSQTSS